ncbi:MAG TPA: hypothetical protein DHW42_07885 [Candidatus Marinimicrobia bacterium]|nr:hypothetical protein [Candidatus Neomarinimicrobiota bacterium]
MIEKITRVPLREMMKLTLLYNLYIFHTIYFVENFYNFYMLSKKSFNDVVGLIYMTIEISVSKIEGKNSVGVGYL